jgi:hypothetical protein
MRLIKLVELATMSIGVSGAFLVMTGGASCFLGLSATAIIKAGEMLENYHPTIKSAMINGSIVAGAGLFLVGVAAGIANEEGEKLDCEEIQHSGIQMETEIDKINKQCFGCKYYSSNRYLHCAVHPEQPLNCPDFEYFC